ncbi:glutamate-ammonia-ligase adenylyltransferase [Frankineae bacterium MT45]|nr:glutamate-ammonia-ligase adenylyltransferase [Frankineae bacterium MT45]
MTTEPRTPPPAGVDPLRRVASRLGRIGFQEPFAAADVFTGDVLRLWDIATNTPSSSEAAAIVAAVGRSADPDGCAAALAALFEAMDAQLEATADLRAALETDVRFRTRLIALLGSSIALGDHLVANPGHWTALLGGEHDRHAAGARVIRAVGADPENPVTGTAGTPANVTGAVAAAALRLAYRRELVAIAGRDLAREQDLETTTAALTSLANHMLRAGLAVARASLPPDATPCRLAVVAMGKAGAYELNYLSDVDVVFVAEAGESDADPDSTDIEPETPVDETAALGTATSLAGHMMRVCGAAAWEVDAALRPEGKSGPLVRTLASHVAYYERWASTWEFQALLKAHPAAGDRELGRQYLEAVSPMVWKAAERENFVADVQAMRRRVVALLPKAIAPRELKLGPGGLRDVEFAVQLLQLVHGRSDESLHVAATLPALRALRDGGFVGVDDAVSLDAAYRFLRAAEHALQLRRLRRTHTLPDDEQAMGVLARTMGFRPDARGDARAVWNAEWSLHVREVRRLHEKLFYRPLLEAVARVPGDQLRLTAGEAERRLAALGFAQPAEALRHIEALTVGLMRRAALQRALLPAMLEYFSQAPDPDAGLLAYRRVSEALGGTPWYLRLLRDGGAVASRLGYVLGTSRYVAGMLERAPEALQMLAGDDDLVPRPMEDVRATMTDSALRQPSPAAAVAAIRGVRRQELLRIAFADLIDNWDLMEVNESLTAVTQATLDATLQVATAAVAGELGVTEVPILFAVIAMGRLGGAEIGYGSDADVMYVFEPRGDDVSEEAAAKVASAIAERLRRLLAAPSSDPPLTLDSDLRPEGRNGPLVRSLASFGAYYARWSSAWEAQALLRANFLVGDADLGRRFTELINPVRYPVNGVSDSDLIEIRRLKARIDTERIPRGADASTNLKLGRGGLADVEWTVQLLQLAHGHAVPGLRTPRTLDAMSAARDAGLLTESDAELLTNAWRLASRARNAIMLVRDKPADQLPTQGTSLVGVGRVLGYPAGFDPGQFIDDYRRSARRARAVVERVFYGPL